LGVRWIDHRVPFQRSARGLSLWLMEVPTAVQSVWVGHDTPSIDLCTPVVALGVA
jgi:hypothetical protein